MIGGLEFGLRALASRPDGLGIVAVECAGGLSVIAAKVSIILDGNHQGHSQRRPILIVSRNEQRDTERPAHDRLLLLSTRTFSKPQR